MKTILSRRNSGVVWVCIALLGLFAEATVAEPNLISWWKFDGDADDSAGSNDGTLHGDPNWIAGQIDDALQFDGQDDYVDCGDIDEIDGTTNLTITAWINTNSISVDKLISRKGQDKPPYYFWVRSDYTISFGIFRSTNTYMATTTETISPNQWFFVAGTYDGETIRTYINGIEKATNTDPSGAINSNSATVTIGYPYPGTWPNSWFDGAIDDVRIYDRALSAEEVTAIYAAGFDKPAIGFSPVQFEFSAHEGGANPADQILSIYNIGPNTLNWQVTDDCAWLDAEPNSGSSTGEVDDVNLSVDITGLGVGVYDCNLTISDPCALNSPKIAAITLYIGGDADGKLHVPSEYGTIQEAIDAAVPGDVVIVAVGTYTGDGNRDLDFGGKAITVRSSDPEDPCMVAATVIDCENLAGHRGFYFHSGEGTNSIVLGLTIKGGEIAGDPAKGGGIYCSGASPTIENCIIADNTAKGPKGSIG
jgi:hypothetical protein